jgi:EAL domain-containing protein (putative c-di-GMP-specific phosphodiesterase class I)
VSPTALSPSIAGVIAATKVRTLFQPIVDVDSLETVAYEALSRGPRATDWESPQVLLEAAYREDCVAELDWTFRKAAFESALKAGFDKNTTLFVNVETATLGTDAPPRVAGVQELALKRMRVVLEITERSIVTRPAEVLAAVQWARDRGWGIALDDVGAEPGSLALLPLLEPEVVKLDLRLVQDRPGAEIASIMTAVLAYAERTGAAVLAEGVETEEHLLKARALGARYAQGYLFGRPGPIEGDPSSGPFKSFVPSQWRVTEGGTPFEIVSGQRKARPATKAILVEMSKHLEAEAGALPTPAVVLSAFQDGSHFTSATAKRYEDLGRHCPLVAALGKDLAAVPVRGVRGSALLDSDPLLGEWSIVVIGSSFGAALVARDLGDTGSESERRFDYALTYDYSLAIGAAKSLLSRVLPIASDR